MRGMNRAGCHLAMLFVQMALASAALGQNGRPGASATSGSAASERYHNVVANGDFSAWPTYNGKGVTTTNAGVPIGSLPTNWYGGPGAGATATYDVVAFPPLQREVPGHPSRHLRISWRTPPVAGETQHNAAFRFTFLEYFGIRDVRIFSGKTVSFSFSARIVDENPAAALKIVPITWHSYDPTQPVRGKGYELFESSGRTGVAAIAQGPPNERAICLLTTKWPRFVKVFAIPDVSAMKTTPGHYTGIGFDLISAAAPTIDLAQVDVREVVR